MAVAPRQHSENMACRVHLAWLAALLCLIIGQAEAKTVGAVRVVLQPYERTEIDDLRTVIGLRVGDDYSGPAVAAALNALLATGLFDPSAEATYPEVIEGDTQVAIVFHLTELPPVSAVEFEGNTAVSDDALLAALSALVVTGEPLREGALSGGIAQAVGEAYAARDYRAVVLEPSLSQDGVLHVPILEQYVEEVRLEGLEDTRPKVAWREIRVKRGQILSNNAVTGDILRLLALGLFDDVEAEPIAGSDVAGRVLVYHFDERATGRVTAGGGYGASDGLFAYLEYAEDNLRGRAEKIAAKVEYGSYISADVMYRKPYLDSHGASLDMSLSSRTYLGRRGVGAAVESLSTQSRYGGRLGVTRPFGSDGESAFAIGYRIESAQTYDPRLANVASPELLRGRIGALRVGYLYDTRDSVLAPSEGSNHSVMLEHADAWLGGQSSFTKLELDARRYIGIGSKGVVAVRGVYGSSLGSTPPIYEALRVGGADSLRGYREDRWYGTSMLLLSTEYRHRVWGHSPAKGGQLVFFADYGDAWGGRWNGADGSSILSEHAGFQGAFGYGLGLRVNTSLGPMRLDYARGREGGRWHFGLEQAF